MLICICTSFTIVSQHYYSLIFPIIGRYQGEHTIGIIVLVIPPVGTTTNTNVVYQIIFNYFTISDWAYESTNRGKKNLNAQLVCISLMQTTIFFKKIKCKCIGLIKNWNIRKWSLWDITTSWVTWPSPFWQWSPCHPCKKSDEKAVVIPHQDGQATLNMLLSFLIFITSTLKGNSKDENCTFYPDE